jgi:hypothetical protein
MIWLHNYEEAKFVAIELIANINNYINEISITPKYHKGKKYFVLDFKEFTDEEIDELNENKG